MTVNELVERYWDWVQGYYRRPVGADEGGNVKYAPTSEARNIRQGLRRMVRLYGDTPANAFDGMALETVRNRMIEDGLCRNRINKDVARIKRLFKWAVPKKLLPLEVYQELATVEGLRVGRSNARETAPVEPVSIAIVEATLPQVRCRVAQAPQGRGAPFEFVGGKRLLGLGFGGDLRFEHRVGPGIAQLMPHVVEQKIAINAVYVEPRPTKLSPLD
jgi:hypothetical protein